ncbi:hypothetical protein BH24DEI2_BH24DEI2_20940 [soil metagenome]
MLLNLDDPLVVKAEGASSSEDAKAFYSSFARANPDGSISLELPAQETIHFVNTFHMLSKPGDAMLVELKANAGLWFKGVAPEQIRLE